MSAGVLAAVSSLAACGEDGNATPTATSAPATSATSAAATSSSGGASGTAAFDPCTSITSQFLAEHQWNGRAPQPRQDTEGPSTWKGCVFATASAYTFRVQTTNGTLAQVREKFPAALATTVQGRRALRYQARPDVPGGCTINVEMASGSLYILVDDPRGAHPRKLSPCDNVTEIAEAVVPLLPSGS
ncbi:DUF3558 domain-containing protein [Nocardia sp. NEAU-351]|uniref:DUF3558 domain-containing protein n=2 Tax=Nocardia bovistercoris TaxID=2785916 RepID=A0A931I5W9_9NOCA|nr:DUF3558 domain-containing protein [Nocardia bovistercoris]